MVRKIPARSAIWLLTAVCQLAAPDAVRAQQTIDLVVDAGRPLRVALDSRVTVKQVGQPVTATVVQPAYAFDRIVVPVGTRVEGRVQQIQALTTLTRIRAMAGGDFSPSRRIDLQFDTLILEDGRRVSITTAGTSGTEGVMLEIAPEPESSGIVARARETVSAKAREAMSTIKAPDKKERLRDALIRHLPYHPQFLSKGTVYSARLVEPVSFGSASPGDAAPPGTAPAPESILTARLVTALDSAKTVRGAPVDAIVTQPVFSSDHRLILPEGAHLTGEVTAVHAARHFHRNGRLRFLIESVRPPDRGASPMLASLHSVEVGQSEHVALDDEGGASVTNQKSRFIAPALSLLALRATLDSHHHFDNDGDANDVPGAPPPSNFSSQGVGGFFGWGLLGTAVSLVSRPAAIVVGAVGAARTVYASVFGKGSEVVFPNDTPIQVQLAPGAPSAK